MMIFTILQALPYTTLEASGGFSELIMNLIGSLNNPILGILLIILIGVIVFEYKEIKARDAYIKELNESMLKHAVKNLEVITSLTNSIQLDDAVHRTLEVVIRENNSLLKTLIRDLDRKN